MAVRVRLLQLSGEALVDEVVGAEADGRGGLHVSHRVAKRLAADALRQVGKHHAFQLVPCGAPCGAPCDAAPGPSTPRTRSFPAEAGVVELHVVVLDQESEDEEAAQLRFHDLARKRDLALRRRGGDDLFA